MTSNRCSIRLAPLLLVVVLASRALAEPATELPTWTAPPAVVERLNPEFADERIRIRPPAGLQRLEREVPEELKKIGVASYGWVGGDGSGSPENLSVGLTPFNQPSAEALDQVVAGMRKTMESKLEDVEFGEVRSGRLGKVEARCGRYTALIGGAEMVAYYLVGIDTTGTFSITAMAPADGTPDDRFDELQTAILTFERTE